VSSETPLKEERAVLAVINHSERFSSDDAERATAACAKQLKVHVAPLWGMVPVPVVFYRDHRRVPERADLMVIVDDARQAQILGYHAYTPAGKPYGRVFASPVLDQRGRPLRGTNSVSVTLSHEVCEWFVDPRVNLWASHQGGWEVAIELCDPVQDGSYELDGVSVSNFVTRSYFDPYAGRGTKLDYLGKLRMPFSMTSGGYVIRRRGGTVREIAGDRYPAWKKKTKRFPASRTAKRKATPAR